MVHNLSEEVIDRVIEMSWEDRTPFEAILFQFNMNEKEVIQLMRKTLKPSSFRLWRKRVNEKSIKHRKKFTKERKNLKRKIYL